MMQPVYWKRCNATVHAIHSVCRDWVSSDGQLGFSDLLWWPALFFFRWKSILCSGRVSRALTCRGCHRIRFPRLSVDYCACWRSCSSPTAIVVTMQVSCEGLSMFLGQFIPWWNEEAQCTEMYWVLLVLCCLDGWNYLCTKRELQGRYVLVSMTSTISVGLCRLCWGM